MRKPALAALVLLPLLTACTATPMLPPDLVEESHDYGSTLARFRDVPLWPAEAARGYQRRLRLSLRPNVFRSIAIRIDTDASGNTRGHATRIREYASSTGSDILEAWDFSVSAEDLKALDALIVQSTLWGIYPEHWNVAPDSICIDGVGLVFERATAEGYRFSEANAQCTAPASILRVAAKLIDMAGPGAAEAQDWLR